MLNPASLLQGITLETDRKMITNIAKIMSTSRLATFQSQMS